MPAHRHKETITRSVTHDRIGSMTNYSLRAGAVALVALAGQTTLKRLCTGRLPRPIWLRQCSGSRCWSTAGVGRAGRPIRRDA